MKNRTLFTLFLLAMFAWRMVLAVNAKHGDMYNSLDWGYGAVKYGLGQFYDLPKEAWPHSRPNQPPGSIYFHLASVELSQGINYLINTLNSQVPIFPSKLVWWWQWNGDLATIKLPPILGDFALAAAILAVGRMTKRVKVSLIVAAVYLINPALWYNSAFWGHTDAVVAALSIWSLVTLWQRRTLLSPILLGLSFITKASWLFIVPLYLLYFWRNYRQKFYQILAAPLVMVLVSLPFHSNILTFGPWFWNLYIHRVLPGDYTWITVLAFNFWNLVYAPFGVYYRTLFLGFPANVVGGAIIFILLVILAIRLIKQPQPATLTWVSMLLAFAAFLFAPKMASRYLYPAFPLLALSLVTARRAKWLWVAYIIMSGCYLINLYYLWWAPGNLWLQSLYTDTATKIVSVIYLSVFAFLFVRPVSNVQKN